jgi:hypothetical protein
MSHDLLQLSTEPSSLDARKIYEQPNWPYKLSIPTVKNSYEDRLLPSLSFLQIKSVPVPNPLKSLFGFLWIGQDGLELRCIKFHVS